ncbi:DedA family protein (plasmid) [Rhizobium grahamii]|uniref:DedA family protein n=1 Tax=Rhizobium grahamii TaxID=1120045 RepID=A0A5Q0CHM3_9HYPH|nr:MULTISPECIES: DedA family protein [Rhizobium]QFY63831.1 DedA family protein [Rhizobium grahamii]QRM52925.1 DedA family protein [Rhizobium sp. BG6]
MLEDYIARYGVAAVFVGAGIEGETAAFLGGILAHRHLLPYWQIAIAACLGSFVADQFYFFAGRFASQWSLVQRLIRSPFLERATQLLEAYPTSFILAFRFIYGVRTVSPVAIGLSKISARKFVILNAVAAVVWGVGITAIGYLFGNVVEALFGRLLLHTHLVIALAGIAAVLAASIYAIRPRLFGRRRGAARSE